MSWSAGGEGRTFPNPALCPSRPPLTQPLLQGKHLYSLLKDARDAYQDKKASLTQADPPRTNITRAQTFNAAPSPRELLSHQSSDRRLSHDDIRSAASSRRSHRSARRGSAHDDQHISRSRGTHPPPAPGSQALTEDNLRALSEASGPSAAPRSYRAPYAQSASKEMVLSRTNLAGPSGASRAPSGYGPPGRAPTMPVMPAGSHRGGGAGHHAPSAVTGTSTAIPTPRQSMAVHRSRSDPSMREMALARKLDQQIDMNLAYGPHNAADLAARTDLDPLVQARASENRARNLVKRIESLLVEGQAIHHSATHIISSLQTNPERAAAVAFALAELSGLLSKVGPAFVGMLKGGSPAVWSLLASPQFLIGAAGVVGVTVVMFGGWKMVKRIREERRARAEEMAAMHAFAGGPAYEMGGLGGVPYDHYVEGGWQHGEAAGYYGDHHYHLQDGHDGVDEALVLEELSTIETWRRGIAPAYLGEDGGIPEEEFSAADLELISPSAKRRRAQHEEDMRTEMLVRPDDSISRVGIGSKDKDRRSGRSSHHGSSSKGRSKSHHSSSRRRHASDDAIPERKSSKGFADGGSEASGSRKSHVRTSDKESTKGSSASKRSVKAIEGRKDDHSFEDLVMRPRNKSSDAQSMLKSIFKKKKDKEREAVSHA